MSESELVAGPAAGSPMWNPRGRWTWFDGERLVSQARSGQIRMGMGRLAGRGGGGYWSGKFREEHGDSRSNLPCLLFVSAGLIDERSWGSTATSTEYTVPPIAIDTGMQACIASLACRISLALTPQLPGTIGAKSLVLLCLTWTAGYGQQCKHGNAWAWHGMAGIGESGIQGAEGE